MVRSDINRYRDFARGALLSFACPKESKQRKRHPSFTAFLRLVAIFLTLNFELATLRQAKFS
ncbi:hypothetical protein FXB85_09925 [Aggregatibacter actinomycetemcomitans]|nr:hypothetical protein FXB85_09925 [Aggregatibacter actinomycetemcomitans]